jgi:hypothetical protein
LAVEIGGEKVIGGRTYPRALQQIHKNNKRISLEEEADFISALKDAGADRGRAFFFLVLFASSTRNAATKTAAAVHATQRQKFKRSV